MAVRMMYLICTLILGVVGFCLAFVPRVYVSAANWWTHLVGGRILLEEAPFQKKSSRLAGFIMFLMGAWMFSKAILAMLSH